MAIRNLFTSSSEDGWRSYWKAFLLTGLCLCLLIYGGFYLIDPYDCYPFSIKAERGPVSSDARYFHTLLARSNRFDSAVIGASTSRVLQPKRLDPLFKATFVNLSFNAASAYEQSRMLALFLRHHPAVNTVIWGLDMVWYKTEDHYTRFARPDEDFPEWLYGEDRWKRPMAFNLKNLEHSWNQLLYMASLKTFEYGADGFTPYRDKPMPLDEKRMRIYGSILPKVKKTVVDPVRLSDEELKNLVFPGEAILKASLDSLPVGTRKVLFFAPYHYYHQPPEGSRKALVLEEFKRRVVRLAKRYHHIYLFDFMIQSPFTTNDAFYLDEVHTTTEAGEVLADQLYKSTQLATEVDARVLYHAEPSGSVQQNCQRAAISHLCDSVLWTTR